MQSSLLIVTLDRPDDLARCLHSTTRLIKGFDEIIIVEQGDLKKTEAIIQQFNHLNIKLYFHSVASAAQARNKAIEKAQGEFIFFVDDDTELPPNYVQIALDYFISFPEVVGLTGPIANNMEIFNRSWKLKLYQWLFLLNNFNLKITRAGYYCNDWGRVKKRSTWWLPGCHMAYRRTIFDKGFRFNCHFVSWSAGEDIMFSYQVHQFYGADSLIYLPSFKLEHYESAATLNTQVIKKMQIIYRFIFWQQEIYKGSFFNMLCYVYSQLGELILVCLPKNKPIIKNLNTVIQCYFYLFVNHKRIINNQIDYNAFILKN